GEGSDRRGRAGTAPGIDRPGPWAYRRSFVLQLQVQLAELLTDLVERGDAEVLAFQKLIAGAAEQLAEGVDAELGHALAGADRQVEVPDRLDQQRPVFGRERLGLLVGRDRRLASPLQRHAQPETLGGHHLLD